MNLTKLFETQRKLDDRIVKEKGLEGQDLLPMKILALQVELGELANEWRGFKFWSEDREPRTSKKVECHACRGLGEFHHRVFSGTQHVDDKQEICLYCEGTGWQEDKNPLLEEYVDCLHFILSIGLEVGDVVFDMDDYEIHFEGMKDSDVTEQFIVTNWLVGYLIENQIHYEQTLFSVLKLGESLSFTWEQIEQAYYAKNAINHERQSDGY